MTQVATPSINSPAPTNAAPLKRLDDGFLPIAEIKQRIRQIGLLLKEVMVENVDYGIIPGTGRQVPRDYEDAIRNNDDRLAQEILGGPGMIVRDGKVYKAVLLQSGAQVICQMFRLAPEYVITAHDMPNGHREYEAVCTLKNIVTGDFWGQGVGSASTMESKHRYRGSQGESTGNTVPRPYWDARNAGDYKQAEKIIGGPGFFAKKGDTGQWEIFKKLAEKSENPDPADQFNTVKKMAAKRAFVAATMVVGASRLFTQDLMEEDADEDHPDDPTPTARPQASAPAPAPAPSTRRPPANDPARLFEAFNPLGVTDADLEAFIQAPASQWDDDNFNSLRAIYAEIRSGAKRPGDYFPRLSEAQRDTLKSLHDRIWTAARQLPPTMVDTLCKSHGILDGAEGIDGCDKTDALTLLAKTLEGKVAESKGGAR